MNIIQFSGEGLTMSSREIAELTGKEHRNVMRDIRAMLVDLYGEGGVLSFEHTLTNPQNGQTYPVFNLPKDLTLTLVAGYNVKLRKRIIDRWMELEAKATQPAIPQTLPEALRLAAEAIEKSEKLALENKAQAEALAVAAPKVEALERISASSDNLTITEASKVLGVKREYLTSHMHAEGWIYRQNGSWVAYDRYIKNGCLKYKEANYTDEKTGMACIKPYCHITQKGLVKLAEQVTRKAA